MNRVDVNIFQDTLFTPNNRPLFVYKYYTDSYTDLPGTREA